MAAVMATVEIVSPASGERVQGTVEVRVRVNAADSVSDVTVVIGPPASGTRPADAVGGDDFVYRWDTTRKLDEPDDPAPADALFRITARASVDGVEETAPYVSVVTANVDPGDRPLRPADESGWRPELAWAADYTGTIDNWQNSNFATIGEAYATLTDDPVLGAKRRAVRVAMPESARFDAEQATPTTVRFQSSSPQVIRGGR